jgi:hypothetical protein
MPNGELFMLCFMEVVEEQRIRMKIGKNEFAEQAFPVWKDAPRRYQAMLVPSKPRVTAKPQKVTLANAFDMALALRTNLSDLAVLAEKRVKELGPIELPGAKKNRS